jgi:hypothetical protein
MSLIHNMKFNNNPSYNKAFLGPILALFYLNNPNAKEDDIKTFSEKMNIPPIDVIKIF